MTRLVLLFRQKLETAGSSHDWDELLDYLLAKKYTRVFEKKKSQKEVRIAKKESNRKAQ